MTRWGESEDESKVTFTFDHQEKDAKEPGMVVHL
jgi:hypothetical protein